MRMEMEKKDRSSVTEEEFLRLAQLIPPRYYSDLGIHLGISSAELDHIIVQHSLDYKDALMTMFTRWRDGQHPDEDIRALLAEGLEKSDLGGLSKELLAGNLIQKTTDVRQTTATTSRASTSTGAADITVSEEELLMLSMEIGPTYYKRVGVNLNISFVTLDKIKKDTQDTTDALMTVFTRWRDKQLPDTNIRAHLAEALQKSGLVLLSQKLITGNLLGTGASMPASQTQPLTPDLVERCRKELQSHYRRYFCKIRADSLNPRSLAPCKDIYTHLVLEEEDYRNKKRSLEYKDLFKLKINGEFPNRIIIQGEAGAGKTTLCAKIAWDWIDGSPDVPKFVWVLVIPLREVKRCTIGQIVKSYLSKDNPATACQITEYIRSNPEKVFIACDGLDEFSGKVVQHSETKQELEGAQPEPDGQPDARATSKRPKLMGHMSTRTPIAPLMPRGSISDASESTTEEDDISLVHILRSDELSNCPVMVTSRPWKANEIKWDLNLMKLYAFIHVEGFSKKNVEVYIHKYFKDNTVTADQLIQMIKGNNIISEYMAPYPIYISMLCLMWRGLDDKKKELFKTIRTFSQLFHEMFEFLNMHYVQKEIQDLRSPSFNDHRSKIEKLMEPVAKLAFAGLQWNNLIFNEEDLEQYSDSVKIACKVGVLSQENKLSSIHDKSRPFLQSTFFFPHKLFQEYMAAVYLASLYDSDRNEFNRLIEEVVLFRKEEFRYLLYFTVSQNKNIANYITTCLLQQYTQSQDKEEMNFLVDVTFESQDEDTNAMLRNSVSSLSIRVEDAHTIAGYASTGIYSKAINMHIGRSNLPSYGPGISKEVALMICSAPSLRDVHLIARCHPTFYETLAREGRTATVHTLHIDEPLSSASSHHLVEALCCLPNLTNLTLSRVYDQEFYSNLKEKASTLKVHTLQIWNYEPLSSASSHHLVEALCFLPNLTNLRLQEVCDQEFCSHLNEKASTLKVHTLHIDEPLSSASSHHLVEALCCLPNLTNLTLSRVYDQEFYSNLKEKASTLKVHTLQIWNYEPLSSASSHHLVEALCFLPNLTNLRLQGVCDQEFCSHLNEKASTLKVHTLHIDEPLSSASSHHLVALCCLPNLTNLILSGVYDQEFYSNLKEKASTLKVHTLQIWNYEPLSSASSHHLVEALCFLPNLTNLTLRGVCDKEFCSHLKEKASTLKVHTLHIDEPLSSASSHHLVALCCLPNLTNLTLSRVYDQEFYSHLKEKASTLKVHTLQIENYEPLSSASSHHLAEALCSLPNLTNLILRGVCEEEELCSHLNEKASTLKVRKLTLEALYLSTMSTILPSNLAEALCIMPNLTDLTLRSLNREFYHTLKTKASSIQGSLPQISKGNFMFNGKPQKDLQSFLQAVGDEVG
ncbi:uncharacterized protein LOC129282529 isoform X2 [Lytechinus pictus]|uniref:uncharacterized protein LOC129282529 isoform X2 n=1 Tax=Lytechinus pictus TaxID=7653 RepID=UPI0030B9EE50